MKYYYQEEKTNLFADILGILFSLVLLCSLIKGYLTNEFGMDVFLIILFVTLIMLVFGVLGLINIINSRYNRSLAKKIKENGLMISGKVISIEETYSTDYKNSLFKRNSYLSDNGAK